MNNRAKGVYLLQIVWAGINQHKLILKLDGTIMRSIKNRIYRDVEDGCAWIWSEQSELRKDKSV